MLAKLGRTEEATIPQFITDASIEEVRDNHTMPYMQVRVYTSGDHCYITHVKYTSPCGLYQHLSYAGTRKRRAKGCNGAANHFRDVHKGATGYDPASDDRAYAAKWCWHFCDSISCHHKPNTKGHAAPPHVLRPTLVNMSDYTPHAKYSAT